MESGSKYIWHTQELSMQALQSYMPATMAAHLGMEWVEIGPDFLQLRMPVDHRSHQPYGILHGGASCALAETVGSVASHLMIDNENFICVGLEINANHIRSVREGFITGTARPIHVGRSTHVWDIKIHDDQGKLICISRLTVAVLERRNGG